MRKKNKALKAIGDYLIVTLASVLYAVAFCWFYEPNGISVGGFTGIGQIINYLFPILPVGVITIVLNLPLFIIGTKLQGFRTMLLSLYCMVACSVFVDLIPTFYKFSPMDDLMLASVFGGLLVGVASGLQMRAGATNGGTELAARLLKYKLHHISVGKLCMVIDLVVIVSYAIVFQKIISVLYGIVSAYVLSIALDFVVYGGTHAKMAYIISDESETIRKKLLDMDFGVTMVNCQGGWNEDDKRLVLCAFRRQQIAGVKAAVVDIDPKAFIIVCDAHEVLGEGFHTYSPDDL